MSLAHQMIIPTVLPTRRSGFKAPIPPKSIATLHSPVPPPKLFEPRDLVAERYLIRRLLGTGGFGNVYEATDLDTNRKVALKITYGKFAQSLADEGRILKNISQGGIANSNVVGYHDAGTHTGEHWVLQYLAMEYIRGNTLNHEIGQKVQIDLPRALDIATQVCFGLQEAQRQGVDSHRDIKPDNIMLTKDGTAKVIDFGLVAFKPEEEGHVVGTPTYMSPEQAQALPLDHRSDIYSLGLVLYEMATGLTPFSGTSATSIMVKKITGDQIDFSGTPSELQPLLAKMTANKPEERHQSYDELLGEMAALSGQLSAAATEVAALEQIFASMVAPPHTTEVHDPNRTMPLSVYASDLTFVDDNLGTAFTLSANPHALMETMAQRHPFSSVEPNVKTTVIASLPS